MIARLYLLRQSQNLYFIYFENRLIVHLFQIKSFKLNMYEFENENDLINHTKSTRSLDSSQRENKNTIAKKKRLKCDKCGKIFIDLTNLKRHQYYCLKCNVCKKQFTNNKELQKHRINIL